MFEEQLIQYGMAGTFILYLIYDKNVLMKEVIDTIKTNTQMLSTLKDTISKK